MCGIAGIYALDNEKEVSSDELKAMTSALSHRGPDSEGYYFNSTHSIGLGHRRLSIIDLSDNGHQPMSNEDGTLWLTLNGEIYNYLELRKLLLQKGHLFSSQSDTEVILHLYEDHGTGCIDYLRGMFAFALWDEKKALLLIARDRIGKKPIYYASTARGFYFASEMDALLKSESIDREIDHLALDLFLTYTYIPSPYSILRGVKKLSPGHFLVVKNGKIGLERYWKPSFTPKIQVSLDEAKTILTEKLGEAIRLRLRSDVPIGCFLSGGVDSSIIVAMISRVFNLKVRTFTIGFPDAEYDEKKYARTVADLFETDHNDFTVSPDAVEVLPSLVRHYGEPFGDSSALATWYLSKLTSQHVKVSLNGDGADELFAGYSWYHTSHLLKQWSRVFPALISSIVLFLLGGFRPGSLPSKAARFFELIGKDSTSRFADLRALLKIDIKKKLYCSHFLEMLHEDAESYISRRYDEGSGADELDRMQYTDIMTYLPEELLVKVDRATMAHSLEGRSPFLDHELIELVTKFQPSLKYNNGRPKYVLKEAMKKYFPPNFLDRPKMGFTLPLKRWFRGHLKEFAKHEICSGSLSRLSLINIDTAKNLIQEHASGVRNHDTVIWNLIILSQWAQIYL